MVQLGGNQWITVSVCQIARKASITIEEEKVTIKATIISYSFSWYL